MDLAKLRLIVRRVTNPLAPTRIDINEFCEFSARIQIVSDKFEQMEINDRIEKVYELFYGKLGIPRSYAVTIEAWTVSEFNQFGKTGGGDGESGSGSGENENRRKSASPKVNPEHPLV